MDRLTTYECYVNITTDTGSTNILKYDITEVSARNAAILAVKYAGSGTLQVGTVAVYAKDDGHRFTAQRGEWNLING